VSTSSSKNLVEFAAQCHGCLLDVPIQPCGPVIRLRLGKQLHDVGKRHVDQPVLKKIGKVQTKVLLPILDVQYNSYHDGCALMPNVGGSNKLGVGFAPVMAILRSISREIGGRGKTGEGNMMITQIWLWSIPLLTIGDIHKITVNPCPSAHLHLLSSTIGIGWSTCCKEMVLLAETTRRSEADDASVLLSVVNCRFCREFSVLKP
jgi:hypothetical protein